MSYSECKCPYCGKEVEINHDDGQGYEEDVTHQQECSNCGKTFVFQTSIICFYDLEKADCLNGSEHDYKPTVTNPKECTLMRCVMCGDERTPTKSEMKNILKE